MHRGDYAPAVGDTMSSCRVKGHRIKESFRDVESFGSAGVEASASLPLLSCAARGFELLFQQIAAQRRRCIVVCESFRPESLQLVAAAPSYLLLCTYRACPDYTSRACSGSRRHPRSLACVETEGRSGSRPRRRLRSPASSRNYRRAMTCPEWKHLAPRI